MRRTVMTSSGGEQVTIQTGDTGTELLDPDGVVLGIHGTDRHDEMVALQEEAGWRVEREETAAPPEAAGTPPPPADPGDGFEELDLGLSS